MKSGEIVEAREWPHPPFHPLNYSAAKVLDFFNTRMKSQLQRSPGAAIAFASMTAGIAPIAHDRCCCNGQPGAANTVKKIAPCRKCASNRNEAKCRYGKNYQRSPVDERKMRI